MIRTPAHKQTDPSKAPGMVQAPTPLADYIQRVVEAEKGLPDVRMVDVAPIHFVMDVLYKRKETLYLAEVLQKVLDKSQQL